MTQSHSIASSTLKSHQSLYLGILAVVAVIVAAIIFFLLNDKSVSTDNAYINGPIVDITAQVSGPATLINIKDNQHVKAGDILLQIDPRPFQIAVDQAQANLALARQNASQGGAAIHVAEADVQENRVLLAQAKANAARMHELVPKGFISQENLENADTNVRTVAAKLQSSEAKLEQVRAQLGHAGDDNENVKSAKAVLESAQLKLSYTQITAPFDGTISNLNLQPGGMVQSGLPLFALIGNQQVWVDANFKETQLKKLHPGLKAEVKLDMYPDHTFHGIVDSISGGSGTAFSLLPPQNATGNWVKITQRVPVKIIITDPDPSMPLRISTSAVVKVLLD